VDFIPRVAGMLFGKFKCRLREVGANAYDDDNNNYDNNYDDNDYDDNDINNYSYSDDVHCPSNDGADSRSGDCC
jgi:hypothetical protein